MMKKLMNGFIVEKTIEGICYEELELTFLVWENKYTYCFVNLHDRGGNMYWYASIDLEEATEEAIDALIKSYTYDDIEIIERGLKDYEWDLLNIEDGNVISPYFLKFA